MAICAAAASLAPIGRASWLKRWALMRSSAASTQVLGDELMQKRLLGPVLPILIPRLCVLCKSRDRPGANAVLGLSGAKNGRSAAGERQARAGLRRQLRAAYGSSRLPLVPCTPATSGKPNDRPSLADT